MILVVFHTAGFNEKKKRDIYHEKKNKIKKKFLDAVGWKPYCSRLGRRALGRLAGRWGAGRGRWGSGLGAGRWLGVQARRQQAWQQALGRAARARACADGRAGRADARGRARQAGHGRAGGARTGAGARGRRAARHGTALQERAAGRQGACETRGVGARGARPGRAWARLVHWLGQFEAHAASLGFDLGF